MAEIAKKAASLFQEHREELGFVNEAQCREKTLYTIQDKNRLIAAAIINHCVRKPQTTIYDIAVKDKKNGYGTQLIQRIIQESPHSKIIAKCPTDLEANEFYKDIGFVLESVEEGKKRNLNVWRYDIEDHPIELIMTIKSRGDTAQAIMETNARIGIEASNIWPFDFSPYMVDFPFTDPNAGFDEHLQKVKQLRPKLTVAPDIEKGRKLDQVIRMGNKLLQHTDDVILVPKSCHPSNIPDRFRVGLALDNFGTGSPYSVWDYRYCESVHILGGSPKLQLQVIQHLDNVKSVDSYTLGIRSRYGMWDNGSVDAPDDMDYKERLKQSIINYHKVLNQYATKDERRSEDELNRICKS